MSACEGTIKLANKIIRTSAKRRKAVVAAKSQKQFQVVLFESVVNLKKCYGCGKVFRTMYTKPPRNLVLKHFCHRKYLNKDGVEVTSKQLQAAYFHLNLNCTRKCKPDMEVCDIVIHNETMELLTAKHKDLLKQFGVVM